MNPRCSVARRLAIVLLMFYWAVIFVGTHVPGHLLKAEIGSDKLLHFVAFAGLTFLLSWALSPHRLTRGALLTTFLVAAVYGMVDELSQKLVPSRSSDVWDWSADMAGAVAGILAYAFSLAVLQGISLSWLRRPPMAAASQETV